MVRIRAQSNYKTQLYKFMEKTKECSTASDMGKLNKDSHYKLSWNIIDFKCKNYICRIKTVEHQGAVPVKSSKIDYSIQQ